MYVASSLCVGRLRLKDRKVFAVQCLATREIQNLLLDILVEFDGVCQERGIRYSLEGGTLLGAARHKGFIPWDDDIDVTVPRPDFNRMCQHPEWFDGRFQLAVPGANGYVLPFAKLFDIEWRAKEPGMPELFTEYLWVDIFPADALPEQEEDEVRLLKTLEGYYKRGGHALVDSSEACEGGGASLKTVLKDRVARPLYRALFPAETSYRLLSERAQALPYGSTSRVGNIVWCYTALEGKPWPTICTDDFDRLVELDFEGRRFKAVEHWDEYLSANYGDYMQLPPEDQRRTHGLEVWRAADTGA